METVFGDAVRLDAVRLHAGGFRGFAVTVGDRLLLPPDLVRADISNASLEGQALLIHEMVHVWQFQTQPVLTIASWIATVLRGGYGPGLPGYRYALPVTDFARLNLEQQASLVEHAFLLAHGRRSLEMPAEATLTALAQILPFPPSKVVDTGARRVAEAG